MEELASSYAALIAPTRTPEAAQATFCEKLKTAMLDALPEEADYIRGWYSRLERAVNSESPMDQLMNVDQLLPFLTNAIAVSKIKALSTSLKRDIREEDRDLIQRWISLGIIYHVQEALLLADASKRQDRLNYPPLPVQLEIERDEDWHDKSLCFEAAVKESIYHAPQKFLNGLASTARLFDVSSEQVTPALQNLRPSDMGAKGGQTILNVFDAEAGRKWLNETRPFREASESQFRKYPVTLAPMRAMYDMSLATPARTLTRIHENVGRELSDSRTALTKGDVFNNHRLINSLRSSYRDICVAKGQYGSAADELTNDEVLDYFRTLDSLSDFLRVDQFKSIPLLLDGVLNAHKQSEFNDGRATSLAESFLNPERLKDTLPANFFIIASAAFYEKKQRTGGDYPLLSFEENSDTIKSLIQNGLFNPITRSSQLTRLTLGMSRYFDDVDFRNLPSDDMLDETARIFGDSVHRDDLRGVQALDAFIDEQSTSLRYQSAEERAALIATLYPDDRVEIMELLNPRHFHAAITQDLPENSPAAISAKRFIELSQHQARKHHQLPAKALEQLSAISAVGSFESLPSKYPCFISNLLRDSASFEGGEILPSGHCNAKGRKYWSETVEVFARSFEKLVHETLQEKGKPNPFLVTVPSNESQAKALRNTANANGRRSHGQHYALTYPAGNELQLMKTHFDNDVTPNMERALSALYPNSIPRYEAYLALKADNAKSPAAVKVTRNDLETNDRLASQTPINDELNVSDMSNSAADERLASPGVDPTDTTQTLDEESDNAVHSVSEQPSFGF
jgi:hypothetical protein